MHVKHISVIFVQVKNYPANNNMFKVDIKDTRKRCEISSELIIKTAEFFICC